MTDHTPAPICSGNILDSNGRRIACPADAFWSYSVDGGEPVHRCRRCKPNSAQLADLLEVDRGTLPEVKQELTAHWVTPLTTKTNRERDIPLKWILVPRPRSHKSKRPAIVVVETDNVHECELDGAGMMEPGDVIGKRVGGDGNRPEIEWA